MRLKNNIIDPTANVLKLVEEAVKRLDDLSAQMRYYESELRKLNEKWMESKDQALALQNKTFENRIAEVGRIQYEFQGRSRVTDPLVNELFKKLDILIVKQSSHSAEGTGRKDLWFILGGIIMMVLGALSIFLF